MKERMKPPAKDGVIDLAQATVKAEFAEEVLDTTKGAMIELNAISVKGGTSGFYSIDVSK